jgi:hypothetical protein
MLTKDDMPTTSAYPPPSDDSLPFMYNLRGDGLAVNMSGQHICVLRVRVPPLLPCGGILASEMAC